MFYYIENEEGKYWYKYTKNWHERLGTKYNIYNGLFDALTSILYWRESSFKFRKYWENIYKLPIHVLIKDIKNLGQKEGSLALLSLINNTPGMKKVYLRIPLAEKKLVDNKLPQNILMDEYI